MPAKFSRRFSGFAAAICAGMLLLASAAPVLARPSAMKLFPEETLLSGADAQRRRAVRSAAGDVDGADGPRSAACAVCRAVVRQRGRSVHAEGGRVAGRVVGGAAEFAAGGSGVCDRGAKGSSAGVRAAGGSGRANRAWPERLLDSALERIKEEGGETTTEMIEGQEVTVVREGDNQDHMVGIFEKDHTIVAATDPGLIREMLRHWNAEGRACWRSGGDGRESEATDAAVPTKTPAAEEAAAIQRPHAGREQQVRHDPAPLPPAARSAAEHHRVRRSDRAHSAVQPRQHGNGDGDGDVSGAGDRRAIGASARR